MKTKMETDEMHPVLFSHLLSFLSSLVPDWGENGKGVTKNEEKQSKETLFSCLFFTLFERLESFYKHRNTFYKKGGLYLFIYFNSKGRQLFWDRTLWPVPVSSTIGREAKFIQAMSRNMISSFFCPSIEGQQAEFPGVPNFRVSTSGHLRPGFQRGFGVTGCTTHLSGFKCLWEALAGVLQTQRSSVSC